MLYIHIIFKFLLFVKQNILYDIKNTHSYAIVKMALNIKP